MRMPTFRIILAMLFACCVAAATVPNSRPLAYAVTTPASKPCDQPQSDSCAGTLFDYEYEEEQNKGRSEPVFTVTGSATGNQVVYFFKGEGCPRCAEEEPFLEAMAKRYPTIQIRTYEVWQNRGNAVMMEKLLKSYGLESKGVPLTLVGNLAFYGFSARIGLDIEKAVAACLASSCSDPFVEAGKGKLFVAGDNVIDVPLAGRIDMSDLSLPLVTVIIAGLDSFNPCAFFVLLSLLGILGYARSKKKMVMVGGVFVFFSGLIYFLFMSAWLNLFLVMERAATVTLFAGIVSVAIALINIKDFFAFKQGISLSIPESAKPKLFDRMRRLVRSASTPSVLAGTAVLAIAANSYELLCTAGFPMVYTRILTLNNLSTGTYYFYLALYNLVYIVPLAVIVSVFALTLGRRKLTEWQGRVMKLVSGAMMLALGIVLIVDPTLMNSIIASTLIMIGAIAGSLLFAWVVGRIEKSRLTGAKTSPPQA